MAVPLVAFGLRHHLLSRLDLLRSISGGRMGRRRWPSVRWTPGEMDRRPTAAWSDRVVAGGEGVGPYEGGFLRVGRKGIGVVLLFWHVLAGFSRRFGWKSVWFVEMMVFAGLQVLELVLKDNTIWG